MIHLKYVISWGATTPKGATCEPTFLRNSTLNDTKSDKNNYQRIDRAGSARVGSWRSHSYDNNRNHQQDGVSIIVKRPSKWRSLGSKHCRVPSPAGTICCSAMRCIRVHCNKDLIALFVKANIAFCNITNYWLKCIRIWFLNHIIFKVFIAWCLISLQL